MKYGIITPAFNEAPFIADFMNSIINQTVIPADFLVIDDGSTDKTATVAQQIASNYNWITILIRPGNAKHQIGSKVVQTFQYGMAQAPHSNWDFVVKLDADQILPSDYFERIIAVFQNESETGICGGVCVVPKFANPNTLNPESIASDTHWKINTVHDSHNKNTDTNMFHKLSAEEDLQVEKLTDRFHVRGSIKSYRMDCYRDIGGISPVYGWDTLDELLAAYHGWGIKVLPELKVIHRRPTGAQTRSFRLHMMTGETFYRMGYGPVISLLASLKRYRMPPFGISAFVSWIGYLWASIRRPECYVDREQMKFIRRLRYRKIGIKLEEQITSRRN